MTTRQSCSSTSFGSVKQSSKVLLCWELGGGAGHLVTLRTLARHLIERGHRPVVVVPPGCNLSLLENGKPFPVIQSPPIVRSPTIPDHSANSFQARSFADILGVAGFGDQSILTQRTKFWRDTIGKQSPDHVFADFAPFVSFAAHGLIPTTSIGTGYTTPPRTMDQFLAFNPNVAPTFSEANLTDQAMNVARRFSFADRVPANLVQLTAATHSLVRVYPHFDPYLGHRKTPVCGPPDPMTQRFNQFVDNQSIGGLPKRFYAYLSGRHPQIEMIVDALIESGFDGDVHLAEGPPECSEKLNQSGLTTLGQLADWGSVFERASIVIHHAGLGSVQACAAAGMPQLTIPASLEQEINSLRVLRLGIGAAVVPPMSGEAIKIGIDRVLRDKRYADAANRVSQQIARGGPYRFVEQVIESVENQS